MIKNIPPEAVAWIRTVLCNPGDMEDEEIVALRDTLKVDENFDLESWPDFGWEIKSAGVENLWLYSQESYSPEHITVFVQALFERFMPKSVFWMTASGSSSRLRLGEFGGRWLAVTKDGFEYGDTWSAAEEAADRLRANMGGRS